MKKLLLLFVSIIFTSCISIKTIPVEIEPVSKSFQLQDNKDNLFVKSNSWMVETFVDAQSVVQYSDKEAGIVIGKYLLRKLESGAGEYYQSNSIFAIIKLQVKDNAAKITVSPDKYNYVEPFTKNATYSYPKEDALNQINSLIDRYGDYLVNDNSLDFNDDN